jgi:hypothetical protein
MLKSRQRATFKPLSSSSVVMEAALNKIRRNFPNCRNFKKCGRKSKSQRATFCGPCFKARAAQSGARSAGNRTGNPGNNGNRTGKTGNKGNTKKGIAKKRAGARSGVKRSSKVALVVKKRWLDKILAGEKDWEIRSSNTSRRGWIHFAESKAGGKLMGRARLVDCFELSKAEFAKGRSHHCVLRLSVVPYKRMFAWVLENAERFEKPFVYEHEQGAVVWVRV